MKFNLRKSMFVLSLTFALLCSLMLTSCKAEPPAQPDQVAVGMYELFIKDDAAKMCELFGYASEEEARTDLIGEAGELHESVLEGLVVEMQSMGLDMTEEDLKPLLDATMAMLGKLEFTAEVAEIDEKAKTATVTGKIDCYDPQIVAQKSENIMTDLMASMDMNLLTTEEGFMEFMKAYLAEYAAAMHTLEPSGETREFAVPFELAMTEINGKDKEVWLPVDANQFGMDLSTNALGN